jgi:hypothetical protein
MWWTSDHKMPNRTLIQEPNTNRPKIRFTALVPRKSQQAQINQHTNNSLHSE